MYWVTSTKQEVSGTCNVYFTYMKYDTLISLNQLVKQACETIKHKRETVSYYLLK